MFSFEILRNFYEHLFKGDRQMTPSGRSLTISVYLKKFLNSLLTSISQTKKNIFAIRPDLNICWFTVTQVCFFEYTRPVEKMISFSDGKDSINLFVTKKFFSRNEHQKIFLIRTFLAGPIG